MELSGIDLAGLAALLGVPALVISAMLPLRDRAVLQRLERIDALLRDTDLDAEHAFLLQAARKHLVRRVVVAELTPGLGVWGWTGMVLVAVLAVIAGFQAYDSYRYWDWANGILYTIAAVMAAVFFLSGLAGGPAIQKRQADRWQAHFEGAPEEAPLLERHGLLRRWRVVRRAGDSEAGTEGAE